MKKAFTDLEQSNKLAEILPIESADMWWLYITAQGKHIAMMHEEPDPNYLARMERYGITDAAIPCWSLAALLDNIPQIKLDSIKQYDKKLWRCCTYFASDWHNSDWCDNPIDACVNIILTLHEHKFLSNK